MAKISHGVIYDFYFFGLRWSRYFILLSAQDFLKWLGMTCNCIWGTEIAFERKKQKYNIVYAQKYLSYSIHEFYRFLYYRWAKLSLAKYSQLSPCGHLAITDTPIKRTAAKSQEKPNCRRLTEINSRYYGLSLMRTLTWGPNSVRYKGSWL